MEGYSLVEHAPNIADGVIATLIGALLVWIVTTSKWVRYAALRWGGVIPFLSVPAWLVAYMIAPGDWTVVVYVLCFAASKYHDQVRDETQRLAAENRLRRAEAEAALSPAERAQRRLQEMQRQMQLAPVRKLRPLPAVSKVEDTNEAAADAARRQQAPLVLPTRSLGAPSDRVEDDVAAAAERAARRRPQARLLPPGCVDRRVLDRADGT